MKYWLSVIALMLSCFYSSTVSALSVPETLSEQDQIMINEVLDSFINKMYTGDAEGLSQLLAPEAGVDLREAIAKNIDGTSIAFHTSLKDITHNAESDSVKISGFFRANHEGAMSWSLSGIPHEMVLVKSGEKWLILESDAVAKLTPGAIMKWVMIIGGVAFLLMIFWLWMLIDAFTNSFGGNRSRKIKWLLCLFVFNIVAAICYFFSKARKS